MSRAVALLLALCALVLPSIARAHGRVEVRVPGRVEVRVPGRVDVRVPGRVDVRVPGRVDVRVPGRASGAVVAGAESRVGSPEFLQRDPEGYADSVNVYAAMANDPINNRDPTGREIDFGELLERGHQGGTRLSRDGEELLARLRAMTGLDLDVCTAEYSAHVGSPLQGCAVGYLVNRGPNSSPDAVSDQHSAFARDILLDAIDDPQRIRVHSANGSGVLFASTPHKHRADAREQAAAKRSGYNFSEHDIYIDFLDHALTHGPSDVRSADNVGFSFLHELLHYAVVGDREVLGQQPGTVLDDPLEENFQTQTGTIEDAVNFVRGQLGAPRRMQYGKVRGKTTGQYCVPFSTGDLCFDWDSVNSTYPVRR
jgi:hypothetical protein